MGAESINLLLHGIDTLQCAYYCSPVRSKGIDFQRLAGHKEDISTYGGLKGEFLSPRDGFGGFHPPIGLLFFSGNLFL